MSKLNYYAKTFIGRRKNNQDSYYADEIFPGTYFFAVADGMGGGVGGEIASKLAIEASINQIEKLQTHDNLKYILKEVFIASQKSINEKIKVTPELNGMGTTLTCLLIRDNKYVWGNIGDSRVYNLSDDNLNQISIDHSYIQEYINEKKEEPPEQLIKNYGNIITRVLDGKNDEPDIFPVNSSYNELKDDEVFVLCSDGLILKVANNCDYIKDYILSTKKLKDAADELISFTYNNGSNDNITIIIVEVGKLSRDKNDSTNYDTFKLKKVKQFKLKKWHLLIIAIVLLSLILLLFSKNNTFKFNRERNGVETANDSKSNSEVFKDAIKFDGFDRSNETVHMNDIRGVHSVYWSQCENENLLHYNLVIYLESGQKTNWPVELNDTIHSKRSYSLGIDSVGSYRLEIFAILAKDTIKGRNELRIEVKP